MRTQPVCYLQADSRWASLDYSAPGEKTTIRASGCGPTALAMVLATWADGTVTPATECAWALRNGWKCPHSGTYYGYFIPAAARYGLQCRRVNQANLYGKGTHSAHREAKSALEAGDLVIACMGKGNWTSSGHYVLCWKVEGNTIWINDPASTKPSRTQGDYGLFCRQVKYYWIVKTPAQQKREEEEEMDVEKLLAEMTAEQAYALVEKARRYEEALPEPGWSMEEGHWQRAVQEKLVNGQAPQGVMHRCEVMAALGRKCQEAKGLNIK